MAIDFLLVLKDYTLEVLPFLAAGFLISGIINEFIPSGWIERHLGGRGIKPLFFSTLLGATLPVCCIGSLPVAVSLHQKGARLGPVLAFLVATPATSVTALLVVYALLGLKFTIYIFFAVIIMGMVMGIIGNRIIVRTGKPVNSTVTTTIDPVCGMTVKTEGTPSSVHNGTEYHFCCPHCQAAFEENPEQYSMTPSRKWLHTIRHVLKYSFVDMVKRIGPELVIGLVLAALVGAIAPIGNFIGENFGGALGYLFSLIFGLAMYICSTASVPLVDALVSQGMNIGAGMVLLIAGPVTSWSTVLVLRKEFGNRVLLLYLVTISALALAFGYGFSLL